jgi:hypothetical protein
MEAKAVNYSVSTGTSLQETPGVPVKSPPREPLFLRRKVS